MALSGSGSGYYYGGVIPGTSGLRNADTLHMFVRAASVPSTTGFKAAGGYRGVTSPTNSPDETLFWNHSASFYKGRTHRVSGGSYVGVQASSSPAANTWHSFASTFDGTNTRFYLDGVLEGTSASTSVGAVNDLRPFILATVQGSNGALDVAQFSDGQVAEFSIYNAALTAAEIASLAKGFRAPLIRPQNLQFYTPCVRGKQDLKNGVSLTLGGGADVFTDHPRVFG